MMARMTVSTDNPHEDVLQQVLEVAQHLNASADLKDILSVIINAIRDSLDAERATVFEYDGKTDELFSTVAHGVEVGGDLTEIRIPSTAGLAGECATNRAIINVPDAYADDRFNREVDQRTGFRTRSILAIPLISHDDELVGVAQVLNKRDGPFDDDDEHIANALASHAAIAIRRGRLIQDQLKRQKLERDLQLARKIQLGSFPKELPQLTGFELEAWSEPAEETGGDMYDVVGFNGGAGEPVVLTSTDCSRAAFLVADATGHGVGPALSVVQLRAMLRMGVRLGAAALDIAHHLNDQLCTDLPPGRFITAWFAVLDADAALLTTFSAGQAPLVRYTAASDTFSEHEADTVPFGLTRDIECTLGDPLPMAPGDMFIVLSDGIFEAMSPHNKIFGIERTVEALAQHKDKTPAEMLRGLLQIVVEYADGRPPDDDRTAIIIKCVGRDHS